MIMLDTLAADSSLFRTAAKIMPSPTNVIVPTRMNSDGHDVYVHVEPEDRLGDCQRYDYREQRDDRLADDLGDVPFQP